MINSQILAKQKRMEIYNLSPNHCTHCGSIHSYEKRKLKFCNHSCSATYINSNKDNNKRKYKKKECEICGVITTNHRFCSKGCMGKSMIKYQTPEDLLNVKRARGREAFARYSSRKKYQTPTDENLSAIQKFYENCPKGYEVDHIIPISKGGAHSLTNLQYLTISDNRRKNAKLNWCPEDDSNVRPHS